MTKFKPCPFCENPDAGHYYHRCGGDLLSWAVCDECASAGPGSAKGYDEAVRLWNKAPRVSELRHARVRALAYMGVMLEQNGASQRALRLVRHWIGAINEGRL